MCQLIKQIGADEGSDKTCNEPLDGFILAGTKDISMLTESDAKKICCRIRQPDAAVKYDEEKFSMLEGPHKIEKRQQQGNVDQ